MVTNKAIFLSGILFLILLQILDAQTRIIEGKVLLRSTESPISSAIVQTIDKRISTATDTRGQFSITVPDTVSHLMVSSLGRRSQTVSLAKASIGKLIVYLEDSIHDIEEVIVNTGYASVPQERSTGSFSQIRKQDLEQRVDASVLNRINGTATGLLMGKSPAPTMTIRGVNSLYANTAPLIVVDNFPYQGEIENINPNDIESITLLKDAAAASIWGARAGNGVIVITTKAASLNQKIRTSFNASNSITAKPDVLNINSMTSEDFIEVEKILFEKGYYNNTVNDVLNGPRTPAVDLLFKHKDKVINDVELEQQLSELSRHNLLSDFNRYWYKPASAQQYSANIQGGSENNAWYLSVGNDRQSSELNDKNLRTTVRAKNTLQFFDRLKLESEISVVRAEASQGRSSYETTTLINNAQKYLYPYARLLDDNGNAVPLVRDFRSSYTDTVGGGRLMDWNYYPMNEQSSNRNERSTTDVVLNASASYQLLNILTLEARYQYERQLGRIYDLKDTGSYFVRNLVNTYAQKTPSGTYTFPVPIGGILDEQHSELMSNSFRFQAVLDLGLNKHKIFALTGTEMGLVSEDATSNRYFGYNEDNRMFSTVDLVTSFPLSYFTAAKIPITDLRFINAYNKGRRAFYFNGSYEFDGRYTFTLSARTDQSNMFGARTNQKIIPLWSAGIAWNALNEDFITISFLNKLRIRATYGFNGNMADNASAETVISYTRGQEGLPSYAGIQKFPNPNLRWEKVRNLNLAVDFQTKNNVLGGKIEYFNKYITDLTATIPIDYTAGVTTVTKNASIMYGKGMELELNANVNIGKLQYQPVVLLSWVENKIDKDYVPNNLNASFFVSAGGLKLAPEKSPYPLFSYAWSGLNPDNGNPRGNINGEPSENYSAIINGTDLNMLVYHGSSRPQYFGAFRNNFRWNDFSVYFNFLYQGGYYFRSKSIQYGLLYESWLGHGDFSKRWQAPGDEKETNVPSLQYPLVSSQRDDFYRYSEATVYRADHIRLQDIGLTYRLRSRHMKFLADPQIYALASNLGIVWRKNKGNKDPEADSAIRQRHTLSFGIRFGIL